MQKHIQRQMHEAGVMDEGIMCNFLLAARANSTQTKYYGYFKRWQAFASKHSFTGLPAKPQHIAVFLTNLLRAHVTHSTVSSIVYAVKWAHDVTGLPDPTSALACSKSPSRQEARRKASHKEARSPKFGNRTAL